MEPEKEYSIEFYEMTDPKRKTYRLVGTGFIKLEKECVENIDFDFGDGAFKVPCFEATLRNATYPKLQKLEGHKNVIYKRFKKTYCDERRWESLTRIADTGYDDDIRKCVIAKQALDAYIIEKKFQFKNFLDIIMEKMGIKLEISYLETYRVKLNGIYWGQLEQNCSTTSNFVFQKVFRNDLGNFDQPLGCFINDQIREDGTPTGSHVHILLMSIYILLFIFYSYQRGDLILDVQGCISIETNKITLILTDPDIIIDPELTNPRTFYRTFYQRYIDIIELVKAPFSSEIIIEPTLTDFIEILRKFLKEWSHKVPDMPDMSKLLEKCKVIRRFPGTVSKTVKETETDAKRAIKIAHHDGRRVDVITPAVDVAEAEMRRRVAAAEAEAERRRVAAVAAAEAEAERRRRVAAAEAEAERRRRVAAAEAEAERRRRVAAAEAEAERRRRVAAEEERMRRVAAEEERMRRVAAAAAPRKSSAEIATDALNERLKIADEKKKSDAVLRAEQVREGEQWNNWTESVIRQMEQLDKGEAADLVLPPWPGK
jgi:hypothetical protein